MTDQNLSINPARKPSILQRVVITMRLFLLKILFISSISLLMHGCESLKNLDFSSPTDTTSKYAGLNSHQMYNKAKEAMKAENYKKAIQIYETLEANYPFGDYAAQTQLDIAYAYFKNEDYESATAAVDRFIKVNPTNPSIDYAYYLKGLVNYKRDIGALDRFLPTDSTQRDPGSARKAYENFNELITLFPDSKYTPDAKQRMVSLRNTLAMYEIHVARYYMKRRAYVSATNRAAHVVENYQRTTAVPYALKIMQKAYTKLGLNDLATDAGRVYSQNYPNGAPPLNTNRTSWVFKTWDYIGLDK